MATHGNYIAETFIAGEAITQWRFVTLESDGKVDMADADAEQCIGVALSSTTASDRAVTVAKSGRVKIEAGGAVTAGDEVVTDTSGMAVEKSTSSSITAVTMGFALEDAASGDFFQIELIQGGNVSNES